MPLPRWGNETLTLQHAGHTTTLFERRGKPQLRGAFTQRIYLASPGGEFLAYADGSALVIRDRRGKEVRIDDVRGRDVRFSADGRYAAAFARSSVILVVDLETGRQRILGHVLYPHWMEWTKNGVVVAQASTDASHRLLSYFPLNGEPKTLARVNEAGFLRFVTARAGSRVVYFERDPQGGGTKVYEVNTEVPGSPFLLGQISGRVNNADASPDGDEIAIVSSAGIHRVSGQGAPRLVIGAGSAVHTVWFSPNGKQLAYASLERATVIDLETNRSYELKSRGRTLRALRFSQLGHDLVVVDGKQVLSWDPGAGKTRVLATAAGEDTLLGAERFAGGTVVWTQKPKKEALESAPLPKWQRRDTAAIAQRQQAKTEVKQQRARNGAPRAGH